MTQLHREGNRPLLANAPVDFLPRRGIKHVGRKDATGETVLSRPHDEPAVLTALQERLTSGDVTVSHARRWTDFEASLIPRARWAVHRPAPDANLDVPLDVEAFLTQLNERLTTITVDGDPRVPQHQA